MADWNSPSQMAASLSEAAAPFAQMAFATVPETGRDISTAKARVEPQLAVRRAKVLGVPAVALDALRQEWEEHGAGK